MRVRTAIQVLLVFVLVVLSFSPSVASPAQQGNIIQLNLTSDQFTTMPRRYDQYLNLTFRRSSAEILRYFDTDSGNTQSVMGDNENLGFRPGSPIVSGFLSPGVVYAFGRIRNDRVACYDRNPGEAVSSAITAVWKYGLAPVWYGGFYMYRGPDGRKVRVCIVRGLSVDCNNEYSFSVPADSDLASARLGNTWFSGHSPGEWTSRRPNATVPGNSVLWYYGPDGGRLYFPGEEAVEPHICSGNNIGFLFLSDNGVPVVGQGRIEGVPYAMGNYGFIVQMNNIVNAAQSDKFSCAGPIVKSDGTGMFPPACGVMRPSITNPNSAPSHWVSFGSFTRSGSLKRFNSESAMRALSNYRKNNRQMLFEISGQRVMGSNATLLVPADASIDSPLVVTIPALSISPGVDKIVAGVVVATSAGKYTIHTINTINNGNVVQVVIPPDIVREVAEVGGEITVRAIVAGDTGNDNSLTTIFHSTIVVADGGNRGDIQDWLDWVSKHDAEVPIREMVEQGWFVPYNGFVSGGWFDVCAFTPVLRQYPYYRYVADVAQASVRLVPIEAKLSVPNPVMRVAVWPDAPQTTGIYVPPETPIPVSTDVPLRGGVEIDTRNVRVAITYTHPISGLVTASVVPERLELMGCVRMPPCGLGWRISKCGCMFYWTTIPVGTVNKYDMFWQYQTPPGKSGCLRHNVSECYVPAITNNQASINADIWLRAVATVSIPVGDETITTTITTRSDMIVYQWTLPLLQETR